MTDDPFGGEQDGVELGVLLRRAFGIVRRHKWWIVFPAALALVPAVMLPFTLPDEYSAIASIEVTGRPEILDVDADPLSEGVTGSRRAPLAPYVAVALSDQVLREVVSDEPVAPTTARRPGLLRRLKMKLGLQGPDMASLTPEQQLGARIEGLRQQLVAYEQDSLLKIMALGETPTEVASLANAVSDSLVRHSNRRREQAAADAMSVFNTSVYDYRERIDRRKQEIAELMKRTGLRPDNMDTAPAELAMLNRDLDITRRQLREVRLRIAMLRERIERPNESSVESEVVAQQRERLSQAIQ